MSRDRITFKCRRCGSTQFHIPKNPRPGDTITCAGCGSTGIHGEVMGAAVSEAKKLIQKQLKDALKKAGFK